MDGCNLRRLVDFLHVTGSFVLDGIDLVLKIVSATTLKNVNRQGELCGLGGDNATNCKVGVTGESFSDVNSHFTQEVFANIEVNSK
jgi:hypothetical protein